MSGTKRVEFRKRAFGRNVSHVVVYASSPVKRVLGYFEVGQIDSASPRELWRRYAAVGGISKGDYEAYFGDSAEGVAIGVRRVHVLAHPLPIGDVLPSGRAPQSYAYLPAATLSRLLQRKSLVEPGAEPQHTESNRGARAGDRKSQRGGTGARTIAARSHAACNEAKPRTGRKPAGTKTAAKRGSRGA